MLPLLLLLLTSTCFCVRVQDDGQAHRVSGHKEGDSCVCEVNPAMWLFPAETYDTVMKQVQTCDRSLNNLQGQLKTSSKLLPQIQARVTNLTARLAPFQYLHHTGLYTALPLRLLGEELSQLENDVEVVHSQLNNAQTQKLSKEVSKLRSDVNRMHTSDTVNIKGVKDKLRYLKNSVESCKSIPKDFRGQSRFCFKGLITNISDPVTTKISPYGKTYISGSWGKEAQKDGEEQNAHWVQPLTNSHIWGNVMRVYPTYEDFMTSTNHKDYTFAPSHSHADANEGPNAVLFSEALYYHCHKSADICRYDLKTKVIKRVTLPGMADEFSNKFPYCYLDCRPHSDVDVEVDEAGDTGETQLWAIYATMGNHGNLVLSRLVWDDEAQTLNVTQTWETRMFKKAVSNAFMACGVLYATRYVDEYHEEVFYAFNTATGKEDNTLALPLQKVSKGMASLSYNPTNKQLYMYNDGYLLSYQVHF